MNHLFDKTDAEHREVIEKGRTEERNSKLRKWIDIYMQGYEQAVLDFAIWRDGKQLVGCLERDPKVVIAAKRAELEEQLS